MTSLTDVAVNVCDARKQDDGWRKKKVFRLTFGFCPIERDISCFQIVLNLMQVVQSDIELSMGLLGKFKRSTVVRCVFNQ